MMESMLTVILGGLVALSPRVQEVETPDASGDLHYSVALEATGEGPVSHEFETDFAGTLHVWTSSAAAAPGFELLDVEQGLPLEGEDSSPVPYVQLTVEGPRRWVAVIGSTASSSVELHWVASPEDEATRWAAGEARAIEEAARGALAAGVPEEAHELLRQATSLLRDAGTPTSELLAMAAWDVEPTVHGQGMLRESAELLAFTHRQWSRSRPLGHPLPMSSGEHLALRREAVGEFATARDTWRYVVAAREHAVPLDLPSVLDAREHLAITHMRLGDLAPAHRLFEEVLEARREIFPDGHADVVDAMNNLAITTRFMGDHAGARLLSEAVLAARERLYPEGDPLIDSARQNLAITLARMGEFTEAEVLFRSVMEARERTLPGEHPALVMARGNLANVLVDLGRLESARELQERVLAVRERTLREEDRNLMGARQNLARTLEELGELEGALELSRAVLRTRERCFPEDHPELLDSRRDVAAKSFQFGDHEAASVQCDALARGMLRRLTGIANHSPREIREATGSSAARLSIAALLAATLESPEAIDSVFSLIETGRAALAMPRTGRGTGSAEVDELREASLDVRRRLDELVAEGPAPDRSSEDFAAEVAALSLERDRLERRFREQAAKGRTWLRPIVAGELAAALDPGAAVVAYRRLEGWRLDAEEGLTSAGDRILAHVVGAGAELERLDLGSAAELEDLIGEWRSSMAVRAGRGVSLDGDVRAAGAALGARLFERLLAPVLEGLDPDCRTLHVAADDVLHLVPFDALPYGEGCVGDRWRIVNEVSLMRLVAEHVPSEGGAGLLAMGGVRYGATPAARPPAPTAGPEAGGLRASPPASFTALEHTLPEARAVLELFASRGADSGSLLLSEGQASKEAFHAHAPGKRFLHLATHGWFAPESVRSLADREGDTSRAGATEAVEWFAPSTLCGLAFAGANGGEDGADWTRGVLTAEELSAVDLTGCELAVLSACETSVGVRRAGQGVQSLQTALHAAGVRSAVTSLWQVDDAATRTLMEALYADLWTRGATKADALWAAKRELRDAGRPPSEWAGWILSGDPE